MADVLTLRRLGKWGDWLACLLMALRERQWRSVRFLVLRPRFACAVVWCYVHGLGNWCEWTCGLPGLTAQVQRVDDCASALAREVR